MCCAMPMMALSGVRISWLTLARNSPLARFASSDRVRASSSRRDLSSSCRTRSRGRVTSWNVNVRPELPPPPSRAGCADPVEHAPGGRLLQVAAAARPRIGQQGLERRQETVAVADRVEARDGARQLGADHRRRIEAEQIAGADVRRVDPAVRRHEDDAVGGRLEDLRLPRLLALRGRVQLRVLGREPRLLVERRRAARATRPRSAALFCSSSPIS